MQENCLKEEGKSDDLKVKIIIVAAKTRAQIKEVVVNYMTVEVLRDRRTITNLEEIENLQQKVIVIKVFITRKKNWVAFVATMLKN